MKFNQYTGNANDDRRIHQELIAMGYADQPYRGEPGAVSKMLAQAADFLTWMRWKGEVSVYGCRIGANVARRMEAVAAA